MCVHTLKHKHKHKHTTVKRTAGLEQGLHKPCLLGRDDVRVKIPTTQGQVRPRVEIVGLDPVVGVLGQPLVADGAEELCFVVCVEALGGGSGRLATAD